MNKLVIKFLLISVFFAIFSTGFTQTNPDDYWLDNGFVSGQTIYTNSGFFYDDGGNGLYQPGQDWSVRFCSENGNPITFDFNGFRTYYNGGNYNSWDYMRIIYSGFPTLVAYNDDTPQFSFTSPNGCITFEFKSQPEGVSIPDSGWMAEISAIPPPVNNDPCDAIELSVGNACSPVYSSNKGAWDTRNLGKPLCHNFFGGDVWFSAVVPPSGSIKIETLAGSLTYAIMAIYRGNCATLTEYACVDNPGAMPGRTFTGLVPGQKVFIRIFGDQAKSGTFGICATDPAAEITGYTGPGGVGDAISNRLWLRADSGPVDASLNPVSEGGSVQSWLDRSGNDNHALQTVSSAQPGFKASGLNNRETVSFDGTQTNMTSSLGLLSAPVSIFTVQDFAISRDQTVLAVGDASESSTFSISRENISNNYYTYTTEKQYGGELPADPHFVFARYNINAPFHSYKLNGTTQTVNYTQGQASSNGEFFLGADKNKARVMDGNISEVIIYSKVLNEAQEIIVSNYLAAKYSFTISADFFEFQDTHPFDLAGIGRVNASNVHTRAQSAGILSIGGASALGDNEFMLFAHDGADFTSWTTAETPANDPDMLRLAVEWKVDITGDGPGNLSVALDPALLPDLPQDYLAFNILVDADGDFSSGAESYGLIPSGSELIANDVALTDGAFIAIFAVKSVINFELAASSGLESIERPRIGVIISNAVSQAVSVNYSVIAGTAEKGVDYSLNDGTLVFNPGEKYKEIIPLIFEDSIVEVPDEYFTIELSEPTGGVSPGDTMQHTYTILGNDMSLSISASDTIIGACSGSVTTLSAIAAGAQPVTFSWSPSDGLSDPLSSTTIANPSETTRYTVVATDALGNTLKDSVLINVVPSPLKPEIAITGDTEFCAGGSVVLEGPAGFLYTWSNGETLQSISVDQSDTLELIITDDFGCSSEPSVSIEIKVNPLPPRPVISADGDLQFCLGESIKLSAPEGYSNYSWSTGESGPFINVTETGSYSVVVTDSKGCSSEVSEEVSVLVSEKPPKPVISYDGDPEFCSGNSILLSGPSGYAYIWSDGSDTQEITVDQGGSYSLVIYNGGCASDPSDPVMVNVNPLPDKPVITPAGPLQLMKGESVELTCSDADDYLWSTGAATKSITVTETGEYSVRVFSPEGCESSVSDFVSVT
ncbi:MAG: hypothetical protein IH594_18240, partial [Bacteroidales bacterium]|nr:hypothetical protein [Bacteroidales bacterium]